MRQNEPEWIENMLASYLPETSLNILMIHSDQILYTILQGPIPTGSYCNSQPLKGN